MNTAELSALILAQKPKIADAGEDAYSYSFRNAGDGYIAVFDGCGGMGAKKYAAAGGRTGAYISSRTVAFMTDRFYEDNSFMKHSDPAEEFRRYMNESMARTKNRVNDSSGVMIKGNMFRELPTTASIAALEATPNNTVMCNFLWAGDSRGYLLDSSGLCQITTDEVITDEDAFTSLRSDAKLRNVIYAGEGFTISSKTVQLSVPTAVIVATDGAFGYLLTPMHFEHLLLSALFNAGSPEEWGEGIVRTLSGVSGDDFALIAALTGFEDFDSIKDYFAPRYNELCRDYIDPSAGADDDTLLALWNKYKDNYYRR
ncbi:MAG: hypothetical protein IKO47_01115 [Ruminococcus sp.]|nr:hypothetical protein [Ruminococcus sp.]